MLLQHFFKKMAYKAMKSRHTNEEIQTREVGNRLEKNSAGCRDKGQKNGKTHIGKTTDIQCRTVGIPKGEARINWSNNNKENSDKIISFYV